MRFTLSAIALLALSSAALPGCATAPAAQHDKNALVLRAENVVQTYKAADPGLSHFFDTAHGYAVFPTVGKGGAIVGGAYGRGVVYQNGRHVGYCDLTQATVGLQLGGQGYSEIIFFEDLYHLDQFKKGRLTFAAQASAVAVTLGASADADYTNGVLVFTRGNGGLMVEASLGGQSFSYERVYLTASMSDEEFDDHVYRD